MTVSPQTDAADDKHLPEAVLVDMDGTLVDTEPIWFEAEEVYASAHGGTWSTDDALAGVGKPLVRTAQALLERTKSKDTPQQVMDYLINYLTQEVESRPVPWMPGMEQLLTTLAAAGVPVALVTSSYRPIADALATKLGEGLLQAVVSASDAENLKPHPEPYLRAADLLGVDVRKCVIIEDSPSGLQAGIASGGAVVGIPGVVEMPADPRISRVNSGEALNLELLAEVVSGQKIDLVS